MTDARLPRKWSSFRKLFDDPGWDFDLQRIVTNHRKQSPMLYLLFCYALLPPKSVLNSGLGFPVGNAFVASAFLGSWYTPWMLSQYQLRERLTVLWGWPRFRACDLLPLSVWIGVILALAHNAWQFHTVRYYEYHGQQTVKFATVLGVLFCVYLWFRATWLLQQCGVENPLRRMALTLVVLPAALLCNVDAAMTLLGILGLFFGAAESVPVAFGFLLELIILTTLVHGATRYVLNDTGRPSDSPDSCREPTLDGSGSLREPTLDRGAIHDNAPVTESNLP
jgi:hypothetical protein